jgi:type I restriction enzyme M protein
MHPLFREAAVQNMTGTGGLQRVPRDYVENFQIPLPPLEVQQEIVAEIEGYQKVINGARAVLDHYRPHISIHPDWPMVSINEVAAVESGFGFPLDYQGKVNEEIPFLKVSDMNLPGNEKQIVSWNHSVSRKVLRDLKGEAYPKGTVIFPKIGAAIATNKKRILSRDSTYDNNVMGIVPNTERLLPDFLHTYLLSFDLSRWASESQPPSMRKTTVEAQEIPLPPLATQRAIVAELEAEQALVAANRELITRFERKIQATLARVWGEETPSAPEASMS